MQKHATGRTIKLIKSVRRADPELTATVLAAPLDVVGAERVRVRFVVVEVRENPTLRVHSMQATARRQPEESRTILRDSHNGSIATLLIVCIDSVVQKRFGLCVESIEDLRARDPDRIVS